jgi:hypothetical protein
MVVRAPRVDPGNGMHEGMNLPSECSQTTPLTHDHNPGHGPFGPVRQSASIPAEPSQCGLKRSLSRSGVRLRKAKAPVFHNQA